MYFNLKNLSVLENQQNQYDITLRLLQAKTLNENCCKDGENRFLLKGVDDVSEPYSINIWSCYYFRLMNKDFVRKVIAK